MHACIQDQIWSSWRTSRVPSLRDACAQVERRGEVTKGMVAFREVAMQIANASEAIESELEVTWS